MLPDWLSATLAAATVAALGAGFRELLRVRDRLTRIETLLEEIRADVNGRA